MRLFVAVELDVSLREAVGRLGSELRQRLDRRVNARWVDVDKMHLTVRFIGHVNDDRVADVLNALRPPLPMAPFEIALGDCGTFPRSGPPRVLWVGLTRGLASLQMMHDEFNRRLEPLGFAGETRRFSAHLTVARIRDLPRDAVRTTRDAAASIRVPPLRSDVAAATLFQSVPSRNGSTYVPLLRTGLGKRPPIP